MSIIRFRTLNYLLIASAFIMLALAIALVPPARAYAQSSGDTRDLIVGSPVESGSMSAQSTTDAVLNQRLAVVDIKQAGNGVVWGRSSGVIVNDTMVATAYHCVRPIMSSIKYTVTTSAGQVAATIVYKDESQDLAILKLNTKLSGIHQPCLGDSGKVRVGDAVYTLGINESFSRTTVSESDVSISEGRTSKTDSAFAFSSFGKSTSGIFLTITNDPDNISAGDAVFDAGGRVVGVVSSPDEGLVIPSAAIIKALDSLRAEYVVDKLPLNGSSGSSGSSASKTGSAKEPERLYGDRALDTMKAIVDKGWPSQISTVVLTTADGYWDALTAAGVAGMAKAPVLMTDTNGLSPQTAAILRRLAPAKVVVCGGEAAVSASTAEAASSVAGGAKIVRCWGQTATGTAVDAFDKAASEGMGSWSTTAFVCTNDGYWDALAAAPVSYAKSMPIFLTEGHTAISPSTLAAMRKGGIKSVYVVGGTAAVSDSVADVISSEGFEVAGRLAGDTAVETSEKVAEFGLNQGMGCSKIGVATTNGYWDALAGAPLCGLYSSVLVLAGDSSAHSITGFVQSHKSQVSTCFVFGGEAALDADTYRALQGAVN